MTAPALGLTLNSQLRDFVPSRALYRWSDYIAEGVIGSIDGVPIADLVVRHDAYRSLADSLTSHAEALRSDAYSDHGGVDSDTNLIANLMDAQAVELYRTAHRTLHPCLVEAWHDQHDRPPAATPLHVDRTPRITIGQGRRFGLPRWWAEAGYGLAKIDERSGGGSTPKRWWGRTHGAATGRALTYLLSNGHITYDDVRNTVITFAGDYQPPPTAAWVKIDTITNHP